MLRGFHSWRINPLFNVLPYYFLDAHPAGMGQQHLVSPGTHLPEV